MNRIQTPITGISTTSAYEDGASYSLVNLRPKNGTLHPVAPRKIIQQLSQNYDMIYIHQNNDYKNWIGIIHTNDNQSQVYNDILATPELIYTCPHIQSINTVGNILAIVASDNIYYILYREDSYQTLGPIPELKPIEYKIAQGYPNTRNFYEEYSSVSKETFKEASKGLFNVLRKQYYTENKGFFYDAHLMVYAFRLYDGSIIKQSSPILLLEPFGNRSTIQYKFNGDYLHLGGRNELESSRIYLQTYNVYLNYDLSYLELWKDLITSVDIFISQGLGDVAESNINKLLVYYYTFTESPLMNNQSQLIKSIADTSNFYLIDSIPAGEISQIDLTNWDGTPGSLKNKGYFRLPRIENLSDIDNLHQQETLPIDNFSHNQLSANVSYVYNNRLHIAHIKNTLFNGFTANHFSMLLPQDNNGYEYNYYNGYNFLNDNYLQNYYPYGIMIAVDIKINNKLYTQYTTYNHALFFWLNPYFSYPDPRATQARFYEIMSDNTYRLIYQIELQASSHLNLSYYLSTDLDKTKVNVPKPNQSNQPIINIDTSTINNYTEPNKIKVSELNNPLRFPNINTYQVSNGTILALATNTMNVSDRNYGQYPLYIFTTQGIWTLNIGSGDVVYSTLSAPTYAEAPTSHIVGETPLGVVFTTQRGLMIINGQSVEFISPQMEYEYQQFNIELPEAQCKNVIQLFNDKSFKDYLKGVEHLIYNPHENELIISDRESDYQYIFNFYSQSFYKSTEPIDLVVGNAFPQLYVVKNNQLKDYITSQTSHAHICMVSRPLRFGTPDIKNLERIILRGLLVDIQNVEEGKKSVIMLHYSNDGVNFPAL